MVNEFNYLARMVPTFTSLQIIRPENLYNFLLGLFVFHHLTRLFPEPLLMNYIRNEAVHCDPGSATCTDARYNSDILLAKVLHFWNTLPTSIAHDCCFTWFNRLLKKYIFIEFSWSTYTESILCMYTCILNNAHMFISNYISIRYLYCLYCFFYVGILRISSDHEDFLQLSRLLATPKCVHCMKKALCTRVHIESNSISLCLTSYALPNSNMVISS